MTINTEMFARIQDVIIANPEQHDQSYFENGSNDSVCGTTRCVAGWAIHLWGQDNGINGTLRDIRQKYIEARDVDAIVKGQGVYIPEWTPSDEKSEWIDSEHIGGDILGITQDQAYGLFFNMDDDDALRMVKEYAQGATDVRRSWMSDED